MAQLFLVLSHTESRMTISDGDIVLHLEGALRAYTQSGVVETDGTSTGIRIKGRVPTFYTKQVIITVAKQQLAPDATIEHYDLVVD